MTKSRTLIWGLASIGVVHLMVAPFLGPIGSYVAVAGAMDLAGAGLFAWLLKSRKDPYSISALRDTIDREELDEYEEPSAVASKFLCLRCGQEVDSRLGVCPRCGNPM